MENLNNFITMDYLMTFAGVMFATNLIVQFTKDTVDHLTKGKLQTKYVTLIVAEILIFITSYFTGHLTSGSDVLLNVINGFIISQSAKGNFSDMAKNIIAKEQ